MLLRKRLLTKLLLLDQPVAPRPDMEVEAEAERNYRWNFGVNLLDGFAFFFGIAFASSSTIVPLFVSKITLDPWIIGVVAMIAQASWFFPQVFSAGKIEQLDRKKPVVINLGFLLERLPVWFWPVAALLTLDHPWLALTLFIVTYAWHGLGAGIIGPAWQDLLARCFPVQKRGLIFGLTTFSGTAAAALGAGLSSYFLQEFPFPINFAILFGIAAAAITLSWFFLAFVREPLQAGHRHATADDPLWKRLATVLRDDPNFRAYLGARALLVGGTMGTGFLTVMAVDRWQVADATVGIYTVVLLVGQTVGNLLAGLVADRVGHKLPMLLGGLAQVGAFVLAWQSLDPASMYGVFGLLGFAVGVNLVSGTLIALEFSAPARRPTYVGIANTTVGAANVIAPLVGGWIAGFGFDWLFGAGSLTSIVALILLMLTVADPRRSVKAVPRVGEAA